MTHLQNAAAFSQQICISEPGAVISIRVVWAFFRDHERVDSARKNLLFPAPTFSLLFLAFSPIGLHNLVTSLKTAHNSRIFSGIKGSNTHELFTQIDRHHVAPDHRLSDGF